jgi:hypothetical protein
MRGPKDEAAYSKAPRSCAECRTQKSGAPSATCTRTARLYRSTQMLVFRVSSFSMSQWMGSPIVQNCGGDRAIGRAFSSLGLRLNRAGTTAES